MKCKEIEKRLIFLLNNARKKNNQTPLRFDSGLRNVARNHSNKMAIAGRIWHGDGVHIAKNNLRPKGLINTFSSFFNKGVSGENVGLMPLGNVRGFSKPLRSAKDIAIAQHKSWMRSAGHRQNILNENFSYIGVGVIQKRNNFFCTQLFYG